MLLCAVGAARAQTDEEKDLLAPHLADLDHPKKEVRLKAVKKIGALGLAARSVAPKLGLLVQEDPYDKVADEAARALAQIGPAGVPELVKAVQHEKVPVRNRALWALGLMGPVGKEAVDALKAALRDPKGQLSALAAIALGEMGADAEPAIPALCRALRDRDPLVRTQAAIALRNIGAAAIPQVRELLGDDDINARLGGLQAATLIGRDAKDAVEDLAKLLQDESPALRVAAADALASIGPEAKDAIPALIGVMRDKNGDVQVHAFQAILRVGSSDVPGLLDTMRKLNGEAHWAFPYILKQFGAKAKDAVKPLMKQLESPDYGTRMSAALALAQIGKDAGDAIGPLRKLLNKDKTPVVRHSAGFALARLTTDPEAELANQVKAAVGQIDDNLQKALFNFDRQEAALGHKLNHQAFADPLVQARYNQIVDVHIMFSAQKHLVSPLGQQASAAVAMFPPEAAPALIRAMHMAAYYDLGFC